MSFIDSIAKRFGYSKPRPSGIRGSRSYGGASLDRLTADWLAPSTGANQELWSALRTLRQRARQAERDDDYMRRFLALSENNVLGHCGIGLQMKIKQPGSNTLDKAANDAIEAAWAKWGKKENCTASKSLTWIGLQRLVFRSARRDGAALPRKLRGFNNDFKYALQPLEIDHLDIDYNVSLPTGEVRMGIQVDQYQAPVAYHIFMQHPGENTKDLRTKYRVPVPANEMLHVFLPDRIGQMTGAPASISTMKRLKMLAGYEEAELVAAREGACKGAFIKRAAPDPSAPYSGDTDGQGNYLQNMEPGMTLQGDPGDEYQAIDPTHPTEAYPAFTKSILRAVASGLGISYNALANDLEGVNYSSLREGKLQERDDFRALQQWFIEDFCSPVFEDWLKWSLAMGTITLANGSALPLRKFDYFNQPEWKPRRWDWVDPQKDIEAARVAIGMRIKSRREVIEDGGGDIEEVDADFENDPVTKDIDTESVYAPNEPPPPPTQAPGDEGTSKASSGKGLGRLFAGLRC